MWMSFSRSPSSIRSTGMPVQRETTSAISSAVTSCFSIWPLVLEASASFRSRLGNDRIEQLAGAREIAAPLHDLELAAGLVELLLQALH